MAGDARVDSRGARGEARCAHRGDRHLRPDALVGLPRRAGESFVPRCCGATAARPRSAREITERVGGEKRLRDLASNPALEGFTLPKVLWLRKHEPDAFARLATVLLPKDYIRYRLTGALATEPSDASATLMYDTAHLRWSDEIMRAVGLPHVDPARSRRIGGGARTSQRRGGGPHGARRGHAGRRRWRGQRVRRRGRRRRRAGRGCDELGDVGHGARADGRAARRSADSARTRSVTWCPTCGI